MEDDSHLKLLRHPVKAWLLASEALSLGVSPNVLFVGDYTTLTQGATPKSRS